MRTAAIWAGGAVCGAIVWLAAPELAPPARLLTATLLGPAPVALLMQARAAASLPRPMPRIQMYAGSIVGLVIIGVVAYAAGHFSGFKPRDFGLIRIPATEFVVWTLIAMVAAAIIVAAFKAAGAGETEIMREIIPETAGEKVVFCGLSLSAGVFEEIAFRGFLMTAVTVASGSAITGVMLSSLSFGLLHAHQDAAGALRASLLGAALCIPLLVTGSIYPSMAAHTLVDIAGGLWFARWLLK
jgi:membrane protease YdiL (CAAX protease family)